MDVDPQRHRRFAWLVVLLLFLASVLNYLDRTVLGVVMPQIRRDLSLSNAAYGLAVNVFLVCYSVFYVLGGRLADWLGGRRTFSLAVAVWSVANMLHALAQGLFSLCFFRGLLGIGEGGYYPTAIRTASEWFPPKDRAKAIGVLLCGISIGTLLAPPVVAWITLRYGWRSAFLVTGAFGGLLIPAWIGLHRRIARVYGTRDPAAAAHREKDEAGAGESITLAEVLRRRKYWCLLTARAFTDSAWYFYLFWIPGYFQEARGFDLKMVGGLLWIPYFMSDIGALGGAWASSALIRRGASINRGRKSILIPSALLCTCGAFTYFASAPHYAIALVSLTLLGHQSWSTNIHTAITEVTPPRHVAMLYGITGAAGTLMGAISQPLIGRVVDVAGYAPPFVAAGVVYLFAIALLLAAGRIEPIRRASGLQTGTAAPPLARH
jgi:ACS family hexuronate transporter-like MFS transporter